MPPQPMPPVQRVEPNPFVHASDDHLSTFALDAEVRFASAADRTAFANELGAAVTSLVSRYHDDAAPRGRTHRVLVAIHPSAPTHAPSPAPKEA